MEGRGGQSGEERSTGGEVILQRGEVESK